MDLFIIPRSGGEITPAGIIAIGQITQEYNLYQNYGFAKNGDVRCAQTGFTPLFWEKTDCRQVWKQAGSMAKARMGQNV